MITQCFRQVVAVWRRVRQLMKRSLLFKPCCPCLKCEMFSCSRGESEQLTLDSGSVVSLCSAAWRCPKTLAFTCVSAVEHVSVRLVTFGTRSLNDGLVQMCPPMSSVRRLSNEHCIKRADAQQPCGQHQKAPEETMLQPAPDDNEETTHTGHDHTPAFIGSRTSH